MSNTAGTKPSVLIPEVFFLRGLASVAVVVNHVVGLTYRMCGYQAPLMMVLDQVSRIGTPLFVFISAVLLFHRYLERPLNLKEFYLGRFTKILLPYIVWSLFYERLRLSWNESVTFTSVITDLLNGRAVFHLYFIIVITKFYLLFPLFHYGLRRCKHQIKPLLATVFILNCAVLMMVNYFPRALKGIPVLAQFSANYESSLLSWLFYIVLGYMVAADLEGYRNFARRRLLPMAAGALLVGVVMVAEFFLFHADTTREFASSRPVLLFLIPLLLPVLFALSAPDRAVAKRRPWLDAIAAYSLYSFGIYLVHIYILYRVEVLYVNSGLTLGPLAQFAVFLPLTLALSLALTFLVSRLPLGGYLITVAKVRPPASRSGPGSALASQPVTLTPQPAR